MSKTVNELTTPRVVDLRDQHETFRAMLDLCHDRHLAPEHALNAALLVSAVAAQSGLDLSMSEFLGVARKLYKDVAVQAVRARQVAN